ncbi:hypothetical protein CTEN210_05520 [Chaetoceros tenuissimus]|uniref:DUF2306 domain-containing protein n=1 Tax=Chaetoceros tenuissimus TaxID=426638 RepID=A0AAD3CNM1_9STRA|nr:hypothetical protein CTEN210_05520 [Chaetoceros tenuissimus]
MFTPIPDVECVVGSNNILGADERHQYAAKKLHTTKEVQNKEQDLQDQQQEEVQQTLQQRLIIVVWTASFLFAISTLVHYIYPALVRNKWDGWDATDPGLYRRDCSNIPNYIMLLHMIGGTYMMFVGPIQLIPSIRRNHLELHKWMGTMYIIGAFMASIFATTFCSVYSNGRRNVHENVGNCILGGSTFVCAFQSFRYIKLKDIESHKIWSYRLYATVLGALLYRLYVTIYWGFVLYTPLPFSPMINNFIFYIMVIPNILVVELIRRKRFIPNQNEFVLKGSMIFVGTSASLIFLFNWLPAMLGFHSTDEATVLGEYHSDANDSSLFCSREAIAKVIGILFIFFWLLGRMLSSLFKMRQGQSPDAAEDNMNGSAIHGTTPMCYYSKPYKAFFK